MKRLLVAAVALTFVVGLQPQPAHAQANSWNSFWAWWSHGRDPRLTAVSVEVGAASTAASFAAIAHHHGRIGDGSSSAPGR
jgi:hypothetical protein